MRTSPLSLETDLISISLNTAISSISPTSDRALTMHSSKADDLVFIIESSRASAWTWTWGLSSASASAKP